MIEGMNHYIQIKGKKRFLFFLGRVENLEEKRLFCSEPFLEREHVSLWEGVVFVKTITLI